jgi:hypothetical protein
MSCAKSQLIGILEIASIINPARKGRRLMAVMIYKFDESYKDARTMVLAGWIGEENQWRRMQRRWAKATAYENRTLPEGKKITRYHAAEMNANDGEYAGWKNESYRKIRFTKKLLRISGRSQMTPIACGIDLAAFLDLFPHRDPPDYGVAYGMCMKVLMREIGKALEDWEPEYKVAIVHDHGPWDNLAHDGFYEFVDDPEWEHRERFTSITPLNSYADIGLQSSDLITYELMRYLHDHNWTGDDMRIPLKALLAEVKEMFTIYLNRDYLERLKDMLLGQGTLTAGV